MTPNKTKQDICGSRLLTAKRSLLFQLFQSIYLRNNAQLPSSCGNFEKIFRIEVGDAHIYCGQFGSKTANFVSYYPQEKSLFQLYLHLPLVIRLPWFFVDF